MADIRIWLEFERVSKESIEAAQGQQRYETGDSTNDMLLITESVNIDDLEFEEGKLSVSANLSDGSSVYLDFSLSDDVLSDIIAFSIKRLNKLRSALESLK